MKKRILSLALCLILVFSVMQISTAAEGEATVRVTEGAASPGETVSLDVVIENNPGMCALTYKFSYDTERLNLTKVTANKTIFPGSWQTGGLKGATWYYDEGDITDDGTILTMTFEVLENAAYGDAAVEVILGEIVNTDDEDVEFVSVPGKVTVGPKVTLEDGYYLIGQNGWTVDTIDEAQKFELNPNNAAGDEYMLGTTLSVGDEIKVVHVENGQITGWYPDGLDNQYHVDEEHSGDVTIFFKTDYVDDWSVFGGYMYIMGAVTPENVALLYGASLSLKGDIALNFYLDLPESVLSNEGAYVTLTVDRKDGTEQASTLLVSDAPTRTVGEKTMYRFSIGLNAKQMNDTVTIRIFDRNGTALTFYRQSENITRNGYSYTVQDYVKGTLESESSSEALKELVKAMSDYGSLAQTAFGYDVGNQAALYNTINVTAEELADYAEEVTEGDESGVTSKGSSLLLQSSTVLRFYFEVDGTVEDYTFKVNGTEVTPEANRSGWYVDAASVTAKNLGKNYTVVVTNAEGTVLTIKASGLSYAYKALTTEGMEEAVKEVAKALYLYNNAAVEYFGK